MRTKIENKQQEHFLTIEQAFDFALESIKGTSKEKERGKIYVWRQRYKDGKLSHKKISDILEAAGFKKVVEERWMSLESNIQETKKPLVAKEPKQVIETNQENNLEILDEEEHFKD